MFILFSNISPLVVSCKRGIRFNIVDFPLPVPPIIAVVLPVLNEKLISCKVSLSAPGYVYDTFLNSIISSPL